MPRNTAGTYTLPAGNPVQGGTTITTTWANGTTGDIGAELTASLSRDGYGGMRAPLKLPQGSAPNPALTFTDDPASGLYLHAGSDVRMSVASTDILQWTPTTMATFVAMTAAKGLTVTNSTTNGGGVTATGNGTGAGGTFTGGSTGNGVVATANGTGTGLVVTGGGSGATGNAITATGAVIANSAALPASGGTTSTSYHLGVAAIGTTSGNNYPLLSVRTQIPSSNTFGLALRTNNTATASSWTKVPVGFTYDVDNVVGAGGSFYLGDGGAKVSIGTSGTQVAATSSVRSNCLSLTNGDLSLDGVANPNSNVAIKNTLTPTNLVKAWGIFTTNGLGGVSTTAGFNISSTTPPAITGGNLVITFAQAFADGNYVVSLSSDIPDGHVRISAQTTTTLTVDAFEFSAPTTPGDYIDTNLATGGTRRIHVICIGPQ